MARGGSKRKKKQKPPEELSGIPPDRAGLPARDSIVGVETFVSPQNEEYKIIHTTERDAYEEPPETQTGRRHRKPK